MFDSLKWIERARGFVRGLAGLPGKIRLDDSVQPPAKSERDKRDWLRSKECSLPPKIHPFVELGSEWCCFSYRWSPPAAWLPKVHALLPGREVVNGGANLCEANRYYLYDGKREFKAFFDSLPLPQSFLEQVGVTQERGRFLMLAPLENDRELVLDLESEDGQRGVGCAFTSGSRRFHRFSRNFEEFLTQWESICYATPDPETLRPWLDPATGLLSPDPEKSRALRTLFSEAALSHA